jgi:hypothetical protein
MRRFDRFALRDEMTAVCAFRPAGIDVKRTLRIELGISPSGGMPTCNIAALAAD